MRCGTINCLQPVQIIGTLVHHQMPCFSRFHRLPDPVGLQETLIKRKCFKKKKKKNEEDAG